MKTYLDDIRFILDHGVEKTDRTGVGTKSVFGLQSRYDLQVGFPLVTTKKVLFASVVRELLWILHGKTNIYDGLNPHTKIWDAWADENGDLGPIYGHQWRFWGKTDTDPGIDQIQQLIDLIRDNPTSRRIIVNAWNVADVPKMALPPCHTFFQCYVRGEFLDLQLYQRSADMALGVPFNIASYSLLLMMLAHETGLKPGHFIHTLGDAHVYLNHIDKLGKQLRRTPHPLPRVVIADKPIFDLEFDDFELVDYEHDSFLKFRVAV